MTRKYIPAGSDFQNEQFQKKVFILLQNKSDKKENQIGFDRISDTPLRNTLFCTKGHKKLLLFKMDKSNICCVIKIFDPWFLINAHIYVHRGKHFFSCLLYNSLARGSCNKWQENIDKLGLTVKQFTQVSRHYFLFLLSISSSSFDELGVSQLRQLKLSRHFFVLFLFFFFGEPGSSEMRELKISRHYFLFLLFSSSSFGEQEGSQLRQLKLSRHYFVFLFFLLVSSKYTITLRGIVQKKWQEIIDKLGLTVKRFTNFSSLFSFSSFFFFFFWWTGVFLEKTAEYFSSLFLFFLFSILLWRTRLFSDDTAEYFSSLFCFCFFLVYYYLVRDSSKKWQENIDKMGLFGWDSWIFLVIYFVFVFLILFSLLSP